MVRSAGCNVRVSFVLGSSAEELLQLALDLPHEGVDDVDAVAEFPAQFAGGLLDLAVQAGDRAAALATEGLELPVQRLLEFALDLTGQAVEPGIQFGVSDIIALDAHIGLLAVI